MNKYFFVILIFIFISGCKKESNDVPVQTTQKPKVNTDTVKIDSVQKINQNIHEGVYITNANTKTFRDCKMPDSLYWVIDDSKKLEGQFGRMFEIPSVYNSVYIKVRGEFEETKSDLISEKYPKTLRVKEVIAIEKKNSSNTCVPYDYWAFGTAPGWSLQISKKENLIELIVPEEKKIYYFFYAEPIEEEGFTIYRSHNRIQGNQIEIKIKKETCSEKNSDRVYDYSVAIGMSGDKKFAGCAIKGKAE